MTSPNAPIAKALATTGATLLIAVSAALGAYYGFVVGSSEHIALGVVFATAALGGELLKPFALSTGLDALGRWNVVKASACLALAAVCIAYSLAAELSLAAGSRGDLAASRAQTALATKDARADRQRAETELAGLAPARPVAELQPEIDRLKRSPGANGCQRVDGPTSRRICGKVAEIEAETGRAKRRAELEDAIREATGRSQPIGSAGAVHDADPLAAALVIYAGAAGWTVTAEALMPWLALIPVLFLELGSALAIVVVRSIEDEPNMATTPTVEIAESRDSRSTAPVVLVPQPPGPAADPVQPVASQPVAQPPMVAAAPPAPWRRVDDTPTLDRLRDAANGGRIEATQAEIGRILGFTKITAHRALHRLAKAGKINLSTSRRGTLVCLV